MKNNLYQIHILLKHSKPRIWRRILINADDPMENLHNAIQLTMGWIDCHLHEFRIGEKAYCPKYDEDLIDWDDSYMLDYKKLKILDFLKKPNDRILYEYDFGDGWEHEIKLEKIFDADGKLLLPLCIKGKMNCPPEDSGGIWGYYHILEAISDSEHEMHQEYKEWMDPDFDPEYFDIEEANAQLIGNFIDNMDDPI
ncbi:MAG: plasmid pRiA4b ORF-3 family protein [Candidatus Marinimicrobia bacterium]|nr:plasmid pRiA4b ORF-3 family protein [Candidatus Neomarinimicrobiota bacterium]